MANPHTVFTHDVLLYNGFEAKLKIQKKIKNKNKLD